MGEDLTEAEKMDREDELLIEYLDTRVFVMASCTPQGSHGEIKQPLSDIHMCEVCTLL